MISSQVSKKVEEWWAGEWGIVIVRDVLHYSRVVSSEEILGHGHEIHLCFKS